MDKNVRILKYLFDADSSIHSIDIHLSQQRNYSAYINNITVQRAVERELEIIGEAISKLPQIDDTLNISFARLIVDLRNKIIRSYDTINNDVIWKIIIKDIPVLQQEITAIINKYSSAQ
jgi:uncharacterized protein with HEPN domain